MTHNKARVVITGAGTVNALGADVPTTLAACARGAAASPI